MQPVTYPPPRSSPTSQSRSLGPIAFLFFPNRGRTALFVISPSGERKFISPLSNSRFNLRLTLISSFSSFAVPFQERGCLSLSFPRELALYKTKLPQTLAPSWFSPAAAARGSTGIYEDAGGVEGGIPVRGEN